jgi:transposase
MRSRRKFTKEFKLDAVQRLREGEPAGLLARSLEVSRQELYRWSRDVDKFGERAFPGVGQKRTEETRIAKLERKIGAAGPGDRFFKASLAACGTTAPAAGRQWRRTVYQQIEREVKTGTQLATRRMCALTGVSRAGLIPIVLIDPASLPQKGIRVVGYFQFRPDSRRRSFVTSRSSSCLTNSLNLSRSCSFAIRSHRIAIRSRSSGVMVTPLSLPSVE